MDQSSSSSKSQHNGLFQPLKKNSSKKTPSSLVQIVCGYSCKTKKKYVELGSKIGKKRSSLPSIKQEIVGIEELVDLTATSTDLNVKIEAISEDEKKVDHFQITAVMNEIEGESGPCTKKSRYLSPLKQDTVLPEIQKQFFATDVKSESSNERNNFMEITKDMNEPEAELSNVSKKLPGISQELACSDINKQVLSTASMPNVAVKIEPLDEEQQKEDFFEPIAIKEEPTDIKDEPTEEEYFANSINTCDSFVQHFNEYEHGDSVNYKAECDISSHPNVNDDLNITQDFNSDLQNTVKIDKEWVVPDLVNIAHLSKLLSGEKKSTPRTPVPLDSPFKDNKKYFDHNVTFLELKKLEITVKCGMCLQVLRKMKDLLTKEVFLKRCIMCNFYLKNSSFAKHVFQHFQEEHYKCYKCKRKIISQYYTPGENEDKISLKHKQMGYLTKVSCEECHATFQNLLHYYTHLYYHSLVDYTSEDEHSLVNILGVRYNVCFKIKSKFSFTCRFCYRFFRKSIFLETHKKVFHSEVMCDHCGASTNMNVRSIMDDYYVCTCSKTFDNKECLEQHIQLFKCENISNMRCFDCKGYTADVYLLQEHIFHHKQKLPCIYCEKRKNFSVNFLIQHYKKMHNMSTIL